MSGPAEIVALGLLEAGWRSMGAEFDPDAGTMTVLVRTPPIPISDTAEYLRLLALATHKESPP